MWSGRAHTYFTDGLAPPAPGVAVAPQSVLERAVAEEAVDPDQVAGASVAQVELDGLVDRLELRLYRDCLANL